MKKYKNKLRLVLSSKCHRDCEGCCNKDWDLEALPTVATFKGYDLVMFTGGEPMLTPKKIINTAIRVREESDAPIYLYTAYVNNPTEALNVLQWLDGITLTLHEQEDVSSFVTFNIILLQSNIRKSFRLNVFKGIDISEINTDLWKVKKDIEWIKNSPLPENEIIMRL